jgi:hypothetical protein
MANPVQILNKLARNLSILGIAYSWSGGNLVVTNGSNALTVSYDAAVIGAPMGGVLPNVSPYLGIGIANPGQLQITSAIHTAGTIADVIDGQTAAQLLQMISAFGNDIILQNSTASYSVRLRGNTDLIGMGQ